MTAFAGLLSRSGDERPQGLPILLGFWREILPALTLLWTGIAVAFVVTNEAR